jgi:hypothetical protein
VIKALKSNVAEKYGCVVFLMHQITSGKINGKGAQVFHHTDSSECKGLANWSDNTITIGTLHKESGVVNMSATKTRRGANTSILVRPDPLLGTFALCEDEYEQNRHGKGFVKKNDGNRVPGADSAKAKKKGFNTGL